MAQPWPAPASSLASYDDSALHESPVEGSAWPANGTCSAWVVVAGDGGGQPTGTGGIWKEHDYCVSAGPVEEGSPDEECCEAAGEYGADDLRPLFRHAEMVFVSWIVLLLVASVGVNLWVALIPVRSTSSVQQAHLPPSMLPADLGPARCNGAPLNLRPERFTSLVVNFPTDAKHYASNSVDKLASGGASGSDTADAAVRYPAYYSGTTPDYCIVTVDATYTCLPADKICTWSLQEGRRRCEAACSNTADSCAGVMNLSGHPLQERVCGLLGNARPSCSGMNSTVLGLRQLHAFYRLNLCMAPPTPSPPPPTPLPPSPASLAAQQGAVVDEAGAAATAAAADGAAMGK